MTNSIRAAIIVAAISILSPAAIAATIEFVPPNDATGGVFTTNSNDAWDESRGIGFNVSNAQSITSVGLFQDLTGIDLSFRISEISSLVGGFTRDVILASGSSNVTTNGLEWIDFVIPQLTFNPGTNYLIEFSFSGLSNQNFFYNNANVPWDQLVFTMLEGTQGNSFNNFVVAAFRVNNDSLTAVPVPAALPLLLTGIGMLGRLSARRKRRAS